MAPVASDEPDLARELEDAVRPYIRQNEYRSGFSARYRADGFGDPVLNFALN